MHQSNETITELKFNALRADLSHEAANVMNDLCMEIGWANYAYYDLTVLVISVSDIWACLESYSKHYSKHVGEIPNSASTSRSRSNNHANSLSFIYNSSHLNSKSQTKCGSTGPVYNL